MRISPARAAAYDILLRIERERAFSSALLPIFENDLAPSDRSLCHALVLGTLRRQLYLDRIIDELAAAKKIDLEVRLSLRLALYQLYYLDKVPPHAAINESVNLVGRARKMSAKGFANAILRRAPKDVPTFSYPDEVERTSIETSHPRWLIEKWVRVIGLDRASALANANNEIPNIAFRVIGRPDSSDLEIIRSFPRSDETEDCYLAPAGDRRLFDLANRGLIYVQDEASQMTARAVDVPEGGSFLDVCAAPGGKTGLIGLRTLSRTKVFAAGDLHRSRVEFLRDNCRRQGVGPVSIIQLDAERSLPFCEAAFDTVLVDAPCSGTGTIRSNPEIRYHLGPDDFAALASKQLSILRRASNLVRPGGSLIYSTCSVEIEENEDVCRRFLASTPGFRAVRPNMPEKFVTGALYARTWPQRDRMDGFFVAGFARD